MKEELEKQLFERFPFFEARNAWTGDKLNIPMPTECGNGWYNILYKLCEKIEEDLKLYPNEDFCFQQIKEKYGGLRVYTSSIPLESKIFDYTNEAEEESELTCEYCGTKENVDLRGKGWYITLCDECEKKRNEKIRGDNNG